MLLLAGAPAAGEGSVSRAAELERIRVEIERLEQRLGSLAIERGDQRRRLDRLRLEVRLQEQRVAEARTERLMVDERLARLGEAIAGLEERLAGSRQRLRRGLATLYRLGGGGVWRSLLTASTPSGSLAARRSLRYLSWRQARRVEEYRRDRRELAARREEKLAQSRLAAELVERETVRLGRLEALRRQQAMVVAALEREEAELARRAADLADRQRRLTELMSFLAAGRPEDGGEVPIQRFKGVLDWPLTGTVVQPFGPRLDPRYRTRVPHNGISLAAEVEGGEVRTVFPGVVVFAEDFEGFGITVVVHHAGRVFSLYSGLASTRVVAQDVVSSGEVVGRASGPLYFEIRVEDRPEDPLEWLR